MLTELARRRQGTAAPRVDDGHAFGAILICAAAIRLGSLGTAPLWTDELFSTTYPSLGLHYLWGEGMRLEPTSPLYYSLIWLIERWGGQSEFWLRLPSAMASLGCVVLAAALARELTGNRKTALLASLILAVSPQNVFYAEEARGYALQAASLGLMLLGFAKFLRAADRLDPLALYGGGAALAIYFHPTSILAVVSVNVAAAAGLVGPARILDRTAIWRWCLANGLVALACVPLLETLVSPHVSDAAAWIPSLDRWYLEKLAGLFLAGPGSVDRAMQIAEIGLPCLAALALWSGWWPNWRAAMVIVVTPAVFLALMVAVSLSKPILLDRTLAWLWLPFAVALADMLAGRPRWAIAGVLGALLVALVVQQSRAEQLEENWRFLDRLPEPAAATLIVLGPMTPPAALKRYAPQLADRESSPAQAEGGRAEIVETIVSDEVFHWPKLSDTDLRRVISEGRKVILIYRRADRRWN